MCVILIILSIYAGRRKKRAKRTAVGMTLKVCYFASLSGVSGSSERAEGSGEVFASDDIPTTWLTGMEKAMP